MNEKTSPYPYLCKICGKGEEGSILNCDKDDFCICTTCSEKHNIKPISKTHQDATLGDTF